MDYYDILLAKKLSGGGGNEFKTGSFTPVSNSQSATIDTGLSSVNGLLVYTTANVNENSNFGYNHTITVLPNNTYHKFFCAYSSNNGSTKIWLQYVSDTPPYVITEGNIEINISGKYFKGGVKYEWVAW